MQRRKSSANNGAAGAPGYPGAGAGYDQSAYPGYTQQPGYASPQPQVGYNQGYDSQGYTTQGYTGYGSSTGSNFGVGSGAAYPDSSPYTSTGRSSFSIKGKKRRDPSPSISLGFLFNRFVIVCVVAAILLIATIYYRSQYTTILNKFHTQSIVDAVKNYEKLEREKQRYQQESKTGQDQQRSLKDTIRELEKQNRELRKERDELQMKFDEEEDGIGAEEADKLKEREEAWRNQVYVLQNATARESKRAVLERFGAGPHHVLFTISIPNEGSEATFQVELAPLDLMPHANHLFLQQIHHELWDNTWIYLNGPHVLQAGPQDWEEENAGQSLKRFTDTRLDTLAFPEYSGKFPHVPWTLGFTGRPGGPDWYINKSDNTIPHGPGGQYQHSLEEQADSCFAKVVEGQDTLRRVMQLETYPRDSDYAYFLQDPVEIVSARIVEPVKEEIQKPKPKAPKKKEKVVAKKPQRIEVSQEAMDAAKATAQAAAKHAEARAKQNPKPRNRNVQAEKKAEVAGDGDEEG